MRIQHNIMAMNAYRNYNTNVAAMKSNLEKLSSGYKINRAGDDAAGLAISEKMRAQITGLNAAQKNVKDGISLVQTAEGAMQEVQDMLNRMVYLATQSANGTYDNEVDRLNLQKEVTQLKDEIDRIADSANFNGIKLLDGTWAGTSGSSSSAAAGVPAIDGLNLTDTAATAGVSDIGTAIATLAKDTSATYTFTFKTSDGQYVEKTFSFTTSSTDKKVLDQDGNEVTVADTTNFTATGEEITQHIASLLAKDSTLSKEFTFDGTGGKLETTAKVAGDNGAGLVKVSGKNGTADVNLAGSFTTAGADGYQSAQIETDKVFTIGGKKFMLASDADKAAAADADVNVVVGSVDATGLANLAAVIEQQTGYKPTVNATPDGFDFKANAAAGGGNKSTGGLRLQIGDTAESFNQLSVKIGDIHVAALGISGVDIGSQDSAATAIDAIKKAINTVSSIRGDLGATQNRLEHTANNLSVMQENIQDAESSIRDTDVAEEMMAYTKNNILIQSAQAMLAQANQVPQGVLQLLQ